MALKAKFMLMAGLRIMTKNGMRIDQVTTRKQIWVDGGNMEHVVLALRNSGKHTCVHVLRLGSHAWYWQVDLHPKQ
jgi:hypothetical protein